MAGKDRRKQLARQRYERQQERRIAQQQRARRLRVIGGVTAAAVLVGGAVGATAFMGDDKDTEKTTPTAADATPPTSAPATQKARPGECVYNAAEEAGARKGLGTPPVKPAYKGTVTATLKSNLGDIKLSLDAAKAPCTVNSFAYLAKKDYFDKTACHRLTTGESLRVLQCGDPTGTGSGGPGYQFAEENLPSASDTKAYGRGVLAMARTSMPGTNGSQFFIVYGDSQLGPEYTIFGKVTSGLGVVDDVAKAGVDGNGSEGDGAPKKKIEFSDVTLAEN